MKRPTELRDRVFRDPDAVSDTANHNLPSDKPVESTMRPPALVNFMAFDTRFRMTCFLLQSELARPHFYEIQHIGYDRKEMLRTSMNVREIFAAPFLALIVMFVRINSEKPMMAFSGVRSSWLIFAKNAVLDSLA
jgi:hypothetical protein